MSFTKQEIETIHYDITDLIDLYEITESEINIKKSNLYCEFQDTVFEYSEKMKEIKVKFEELYNQINDFIEEN